MLAKLKNKKILFFLIIPILFALFNSYNPIDDFNYTHWLFNYNYQFIKRGLIGQILNILSIKPTLEAVYFFSYVILLLMFYLFVLFFWNTIKPFNTELILFFLLVIFHSATLQHFHYDIGRFDQIGIIATILLIFLLPRVTITLQVIIILFTFSVLILIHEALFIIFGPLIFVYWIFLIRYENHLVIYKILIFVSLSIMTLAVSKYGLMKVISAKNYYELLSRIYGSFVDKGAVLVLYRNFDDNFEFTHQIGFSIGHHILMLLVVAPIIFLLSILFYNYHLKVRDLNVKAKYFTFILSAISPLILYPIAVDRFRWISIAITNIFIVIAILIQDNNFKLTLIKTFENHKLIVIITLILSLLLGPLEVGLSFSNNPSFKFIIRLLGLNI